jgi:hypothetical protein
MLARPAPTRQAGSLAAESARLADIHKDYNYELSTTWKIGAACFGILPGHDDLWG